MTGILEHALFLIGPHARGPIDRETNAGKCTCAASDGKARAGTPHQTRTNALPQRPKAIAKAGIRARGVRRRTRVVHRGGSPRLPAPEGAVAADAVEGMGQGVPDPLTVAGAAQALQRR